MGLLKKFADTGENWPENWLTLDDTLMKVDPFVVRSPELSTVFYSASMTGTGLSISYDVTPYYFSNGGLILFVFWCDECKPKELGANTPLSILSLVGEAG